MDICFEQAVLNGLWGNKLNVIREVGKIIYQTVKALSQIVKALFQIVVAFLSKALSRDRFIKPHLSKKSCLKIALNMEGSLLQV